MKKLLALVAIALAVLVVPSGGIAATHGTPSIIYAFPRFYSEYEHLTVRYVVGFDDKCVSDGSGGWNLDGCYQAALNDGEYDLRVFQTYPGRKFVHSERDFGANGHDEINIFWQIDLGAPYCLGNSHWTRRYVAYLRLYSPVDGRVLAHSATHFGTVCG